MVNCKTCKWYDSIWEGFPLFSLPLILIHNWKKGKVTKYAVTLFRCLVTTLSNFIHNPQSARPLNTSNIKWEMFQSKCKALSQFWQHSSFVRVTFRWFHEASYQSMMMTMIVIWKRIKGGRRLGVKNSVAVDLLSCRFAKLNQDPREWESANGRVKKSVFSKKSICISFQKAYVLISKKCLCWFLESVCLIL